MPAKKHKSDPKPVLSPDQEKAQVTDEVINVLLDNIRQRNDARSIELLGKLRRFDLFTRPEPNVQTHQFDEKTVRLLLALPDICPKCGHDLSPEQANLDTGQRRLDKHLKDANLGPERRPVDVNDCTMYEGKDA